MNDLMHAPRRARSDDTAALGNVRCALLVALFTLASAASAATAAAANAANCPADLDHSGTVDGADLGLLLGTWNAPGGPSDINGDGIVDGADLGLLLGQWGPCPDEGPRQFGALIPQALFVLQTPTGPATAQGSAELLLTVGPAGLDGVRPVHVDHFTSLLSSVPAFTTETGGISLELQVDTPDGSIFPSGEIYLPIALDAHYWLIDQAFPPSPTVCTEEGGSNGFVALEQWVGSLHGTVTDAGSALLLDASLSFVVPATLTGAVNSGDSILIRAMPEKTYPGLPDCAAAMKCNKRVVCIQPVFIGTGVDDPAKTGSSYADFKTKAEAVWSKCCVEFDWKAAKYVDNNTYKTLKMKAAGDAYADFRKLLKEADEKGEDDCIEVFFVSHIQDSAGNNNAEGDGDTFGSGTRSAKIIVADDATGCTPKADGVLAHELGHAMGRCNHDTEKPAAAGTVMEPTGKTPPACPGANTSKVVAVQCEKTRKGPMVKEKTPKSPCCLTPDT